MHRTVALGSAKPLRMHLHRPFMAALLIVAVLAGALLSASQTSRAAAPTTGWEPPLYAEDLTGPCLPRLPRTVVRHDLLALALKRCPLPPATLHYHRFDPSGGVPGAGQYSFLLPGGAPVTTYAQLREGATRVRLHTHDRTGRPQTGFYDLVEPGDLFDWRASDTCWARYRVMAVVPAAAGATQREFGVTSLTGRWGGPHAFTDCPGAVASNTAVRLRWTPAEGPAIAGVEWLPEDDQRILAEAAVAVHRYFDRWLGITPPIFAVTASEFHIPCLSSGGALHLSLQLPCAELRLFVRSVLAKQYADVAVAVTRMRGGHPEPEWLIDGHAHYVYARLVGADGRRPYRTLRSEMIGFARATDLALDSAPLQPHDVRIPFGFVIDPARPQWEGSRREFQRWIGALAIDWLVEQTSEAALEQYAQTRFAGDWRAAFQEAFGMSIDQFLRGFAAYRAELAAADGGAPRLRRPFHTVVFFGPLTGERRALATTIEEIVDFFDREVGLTATAATFVVDISAAAYERVLGTIGRHHCGDAYGDSLLYVVDTCTFPIIIAHEFAHVLLNERGQGRSGAQPQWLNEGAAEYLALQYWLATGGANSDTAWATPRQEFAAGVVAELPAAVSDAAVALAAIERDWQYYIYALAVRHLVERFGIDRLLAAFGPAWSEAGPDEAGRFQAVFGESLDAFFASFGRALRSLPAPGPSRGAAQVCSNAWADAQGVKWIDLDGQPCTDTRGGGTVTVRRRGFVRTFTLSSGHSWLATDSIVWPRAVVFVGGTPGGSCYGQTTIDLADGAEVERHAPECPELDAVFDAVVASSARGDSDESRPASPPPTPGAPQICHSYARTDTRGVDWIDLDALRAGCALARDGGRVVVRHDDVARTFTLYGGYDWRVVDATNGVPAVQFENPANPYLGISSGFIRFALDDGRELARRVPADVPELHAIFDAITSAPGEPGE